MDAKDCQLQLASLTSFKGQAKNSLHGGKVHIAISHYGAILYMFDTFQKADMYISVMLLTVELKGISGTPVSYLVLSKCLSHWLASVHIIHSLITDKAQNNYGWKVTMLDFVT